MILYFILLLLVSEILGEPCVSRDYGASSIVCVCNETYCDYIDPYFIGDISDGLYLLYTTSQDGMRLERTAGKFETNETQAADAVIITVDKNITFQEILGFGGAITDTVGYNIRDMSDPLRENFYRTYFGMGGALYNLLRVPMAGSDFSESAYTYDDTEGEDLNLEQFSLREEDRALKIPIINRANKESGEQLKLFSAPWFAPQWMKNISTDVLSIAEQYYEPWAQYFVKYLDAYAEEGLKFWGITPQNEPSSQWVSWSVESITEWTGNYLIPALQNGGHGDITLMLLDDNRDHLPLWVETSIQNENVRNFTKGVALHWYTDDSTDPNVLTQTHEVAPDKFLLYTESCELRQVTEDRFGDWDLAEQYGTHMLEAFNNWVVGWTEWNIVLDLTGGGQAARNHLNAPILVNNTGNEYYKQPPFYIQSHFSTFILPGSQRIQLNTTTNPDDLQTVAFFGPDSTVTVIIMNKNDAAISTVVHDPDFGDISLEIHPRSFNTLLYK